MNSQKRPKTSQMGPPPTVDVAVLTIIPEAYEAVRQAFGLAAFEPRNGVQWALGSVPSLGRSVTVVSGLALDRENVAAATFTDALLDAWRPRHLLLVDIGGAVLGRDDVQLGDVVTHTRLHYYDFKKEVGSRAESSRDLPHAAPSARLRELSRRPALRGDDNWSNSIPYRRPGRGQPKVLEGEMLVGGTLFANSPRLRRLLGKHPKVLAVEMEGVGAARAALDWGLRGDVPEFLVVRGMSDFCNVPPDQNQNMRDRWKRYAAGAAAAHARALIGEMALPPPPDDGTLRFQPCSEPIDNLWQAPLVELIGRDDDLQALKSAVTDDSRPSGRPRRHALFGGPGMGKSALARRLAEDVGALFQVRWWIDAEDGLRVRAGLRQLARRLCIPSACMELGSEGSQEREGHRYLSDLHTYLASGLLTGRVLIILDNVDDPRLKHDLEAIALRYLPTLQCEVVLTSQSARWWPLAEGTHIRGLDLAASAQLIATASGRPELERLPEVRAIAEAFDGHPLLLKQVAVVLRDGDESREVLERFSAAPEMALEALPELEGFDPLWGATLTLALERAERARSGTVTLLQTLSCWGAEPIPIRLIRSLDCGKAVANTDALLNTLVDRCLVERQGDPANRTYSVHRLVAAIVRTFARDRLVNALDRAAVATQGIVPGRDLLLRPKGQRLMSELAPHIAALVQHVQGTSEAALSPLARRAVAECASLLGLHHRTMSEWLAAEQASRSAVALSDPIQDPGGTALRNFRLANVLRQRGHFPEAEQLVGQATASLERHADPCDYAWGITVEARILRHRPLSSPSEALEKLSAARSILERLPHRDNQPVARQLSELHGYISVLLRQLSQLDSAETESLAGLHLIANGMSLDELLQVRDLPDEPLLATHLRALGGVWRLRGEFKRASLAHRRALEVFERIYGPEHTDVCRALDSLGRVQREWGDLDASLETFERARRISDAQFGASHAHAGTAAVNRALSFLELGQDEQAYDEANLGLQIYKHAYKEAEELEGLQNESTVWAAFVRAEALSALGAMDDAIHIHQGVLNWRRARLRPGHAHEASSLFALADATWRLHGEAPRTEVVNLHREALRIRRQVFGEAPNFWLAQSQARLGALVSDEGLTRQALGFYSSQLKRGHWRTRAAKETLRAISRAKNAAQGQLS